MLMLMMMMLLLFGKIDIQKHIDNFIEKNIFNLCTLFPGFPVEFGERVNTLSQPGVKPPTFAQTELRQCLRFIKGTMWYWFTPIGSGCSTFSFVLPASRMFITENVFHYLI